MTRPYVCAHHATNAPGGDHDDAVNMVRHDDERVKGDAPVIIAQGIPRGGNQRSHAIQPHLALGHIPE
jgi:hypothetical protein